MTEERAQALLIPQPGIVFSHPGFDAPITVDYNPYTGSHNLPGDFGVGSVDISQNMRFAHPSPNSPMLASQDCDYQVVNYEELEKLLPDPKPHGRAELGLLPDGSAYAPKTATKENFLLFPSKASYILYFTHHYFCKENLVRDRTFVSMLINRLIMPIDKLIRAPRLAALHTTVGDVEHALVKSKIVCIEDMGGGVRGVRRIDGYPAFLSAEDNTVNSIQQDVPPEMLATAVPNVLHKYNVASFSPCNTMDGDGCSSLVVSPTDLHQITSSELSLSCASSPGNNIGVANTPVNFNASTCTAAPVGSHLIRIPSSQSVYYPSPCGNNNMSSFSSGTTITPSDNQVVVSATMPTSNAINPPPGHRPYTAGGGGGGWSYQQPSLFVVGRHNGVSVAPAGGGATADTNSPLVYGHSQHQTGSSLLGVRARPTYSPSLPYNNGAIPMHVQGQDLHQITAGLSLRPPAAGHLQHYLFNQPTAANAYANALPVYPAGNHINVTMANALIGQSTNPQQRQQPHQAASLQNQFITSPFFASNPHQFTVAAALNAAHSSNVANFSNSYQMALAAAMAAAAHQQPHQLGGPTSSPQYFQSPLGLSPYQTGAPIFYTNPAHLALHMGCHPRVPPPPSQGSGYAYQIPALCQLPQVTANPVSLSTDLHGGPHFGSHSKLSDVPGNSIYNSSGACNSSPGGGDGSNLTTSAISSSLVQHSQVNSPNPLLFQYSGPTSHLQSASSNPNIITSSLAAATANLHIQYPPVRPLSTVTGGGNAVGVNPFAVDVPAALVPTTCASPSQPLTCSSSGIDSKSDTPITDVKTAEQEPETCATHCIADELLHSQSKVVDATSGVCNAQLHSRDEQSDTGLQSVSQGGVSETQSTSTEDSTDESASSGICEMNSGHSQFGGLRQINPSTSYGDSETDQPYRPIRQNAHTVSSCRRKKQQQPGIQDSVYKT